MIVTLKSVHHAFCAFGVDLVRMRAGLTDVPRFLRGYITYSHKKYPKFPIMIGNLHPILGEATAASGTASGHYFHQDLWFAKKIFKKNPARHVDVGSRVDGFIAHLLSFREVEYVDIRPLPNEVPGLRFIKDDATTMGQFATGSLESISSLHAAEHFGLGRYGDPIDPGAWLEFCHSLARVLRPGGDLYFSVPCGQEALYFNAHRVFAPHTILEAFSSLRLMSFAAVGDDNKLHEDMSLEELATQKWGCGLFHFSK
jgi:SAM-dependent methyltransferase